MINVDKLIYFCIHLYLDSKLERDEFVITTIKSRKLKPEKLFNAFRSEIETGFSIHVT